MSAYYPTILWGPWGKLSSIKVGETWQTIDDDEHTLTAGLPPIDVEILAVDDDQCQVTVQFDNEFRATYDYFDFLKHFKRKQQPLVNNGPTCVCSLDTLMVSGCRCPRLQWEREQQ